VEGRSCRVRSLKLEFTPGNVRLLLAGAVLASNLCHFDGA
jgi:hypothetical protein